MRILLSLAVLIPLSIFPSCRHAAGRAESQTFSPGDTIPASYLAAHPYQDFFTVSPIPDGIFEMMKGKSFKDNCTVPREDLCYVLCLHKDLQGRNIVGEMVVSKRIGRKIADILLQLYEAGYPIERMRLPDYWDAVDEMMMRDNNSSGFNFRAIAGTTKLSKHSLGIAVDINPLYNPYVKARKDGSLIVEPATAGPYVDREAKYDYKIKADDLCCRLFKENGFEWGGDWTSCKDYQHFELIEK